jgi:hypothetical protein
MKRIESLEFKSLGSLLAVACVALVLASCAFIAPRASAQGRNDQLANIQQVRPGNPGTVMPENKVPGQVESTTRQLMHQLDKRGYEVLRGYSNFIRSMIATCHTT